MSPVSHFKYMNTRSKTVSNVLKPYKTNDTLSKQPANVIAGKKDEPQADLNGVGKDIKEMNVDEKLNMLIASVAKLETVPQDIEK